MGSLSLIFARSVPVPIERNPLTGSEKPDRVRPSQDEQRERETAMTDTNTQEPCKFCGCNDEKKVGPINQTRYLLRGRDGTQKCGRIAVPGTWICSVCDLFFEMAL